MVDQPYIPPATIPATWNVKYLHRGWSDFGIAKFMLSNGLEVERAFEHHGGAVAVLPYDPKRKVALFVEQNRIAPQIWGQETPLLEVPAGRIGEEVPEVAAAREALEEAGVQLAELELVSVSYPMPNLSSERLWLYLATYQESDRVCAGGGIANETEFITVAELPLDLLDSWMAAGSIEDLKTLALLQALKMRRANLFENSSKQASRDLDTERDHIDRKSV